MRGRGRGGSHLRSPQAKGWAQRKVERGCRPSVQRKKGEEADDSEYDVSMAVASQMGRRPRTEKTIDHFEKAPRSPHVRTICARSRHAYKDYGLLREFVLKVAPLTRTPKKTKKKDQGKVERLPHQDWPSAHHTNDAGEDVSIWNAAWTPQSVLYSYHSFPGRLVSTVNHPLDYVKRCYISCRVESNLRTEDTG